MNVFSGVLRFSPILAITIHSLAGADVIAVPDSPPPPRYFLESNIAGNGDLAVSGGKAYLRRDVSFSAKRVYYAKKVVQPAIVLYAVLDARGRELALFKEYATAKYYLTQKCPYQQQCRILQRVEPAKYELVKTEENVKLAELEKLLRDTKSDIYAQSKQAYYKACDKAGAMNEYVTVEACEEGQPCPEPKKVESFGKFYMIPFKWAVVSAQSRRVVAQVSNQVTGCGTVTEDGKILPCSTNIQEQPDEARAYVLCKNGPVYEEMPVVDSQTGAVSGGILNNLTIGNPAIKGPSPANGVD